MILLRTFRMPLAWMVMAPLSPRTAPIVDLTWADRQEVASKMQSKIDEVFIRDFLSWRREKQTEADVTEVLWGIDAAAE